MAEPSKHIYYSFEDIQRYLQGKMPAPEMHSIEKAALKDPFLADAIEGFNKADFTVAKQHLNEINAGLFAEKQKPKVVAFNNRTQWLNIAAIIIVLAGIGLIAAYFLKTNSLNQQIEIAKLQQEPAKNEIIKDSLSTLPNTNTLNQKADTGLFIAENNIVKKTLRPTAERRAAEKNIIQENSIVKAGEPGEHKADVAPIAPASPAEEKTMMARSFAVADSSFQLQGKVNGLSVLPSPATFSGKVVDENNKPIAGVTIASADKKAAVLSDINGNFNLQQTDTLLNVTAGAVGYDTRTIALKQGANNPIVLKQNNAALNEVVVVGYGTKRKRNAYTDSITSAERKANGDSAMPVGGWNNFNHYVITQLNKDTATSALTNPNDIVELEFLIDNAGNPYNIKVKKSPGEAQSAKATEILKNGPKWTSSFKKKKAKVIISF